MSAIEIIDFGFNVCRACLTPGTVTHLSTIFDENWDTTSNLFHVPGLELSRDVGLFPALLCDGCLKILNMFIEMRKKLPLYDEIYFQPYREAHEKTESVQTSSKIDINTILTPADKMKISVQLKRRDSIIPKSKKPKDCPHSLTQDNVENVPSKNHTVMHLPNNLQDLKNDLMCPFCKKSFCQQYMKNHIQSVHLKIKRHFCDLCPYASFFAEKLKVHRAGRHSQLRQFKCEVQGCSRAFKYKDGLSQHKKRVKMHSKLQKTR